MTRDEGARDLSVQDDAIIGVALKWSLAVVVPVVVVITVALVLRRDEAPAPPPIERTPVVAPAPAPAVTPPALPFTDVTATAGIDFRHAHHATPQRLLPETMGAGAAFLDADGDGDQDLIFANGGPWAEPEIPGPGAVLHRNRGDGTFEPGEPLGGPRCGTGVACADYDADGRVDVYLTGLGPNRLLRNTERGFVDVTEAAGVTGGDEWSTSAGFFDYDGDGDLDLFVGNYVQWSPDIDTELAFTLNGTDRAYGPPTNFAGAHCALFRNDGGTFTDVSGPAGIRIENPATGAAMAKALAVTFADVDGDGRLDVLVANDTVQNFLFRNTGHGTFEEMGAASGVAFDGMGNATGAMGMDAQPLDGAALFVAIGNFGNEKTSLYVQQGSGQFADMADALGLGAPSRVPLTFGVFFFDADLDGRLDLLHANGHLDDRVNEVHPSQHYRQAAQLFWNAGGAGRGRFAAVPAETLGDLARPIVGRGATYADVDGDGDLDVLLTELGSGPLLARNDQALGHHWLRVKLDGAAPNRDAIGATIELAAGGQVQRRMVMPTRSYLSQVELPVTFGLGDAERVESLTVTWPDGVEQAVEVDGVDRVVRVTRGG